MNNIYNGGKINKTIRIGTVHIVLGLFKNELSSTWHYIFTHTSAQTTDVVSLIAQEMVIKPKY